MRSGKSGYFICSALSLRFCKRLRPQTTESSTRSARTPLFPPQMLSGAALRIKSRIKRRTSFSAQESPSPPPEINTLKARAPAEFAMPVESTMLPAGTVRRTKKSGAVIKGKTRHERIPYVLCACCSICSENTT